MRAFKDLCQGQRPALQPVPGIVRASLWGLCQKSQQHGFETLTHSWLRPNCRRRVWDPSPLQARSDPIGSRRAPDCPTSLSRGPRSGRQGNWALTLRPPETSAHPAPIPRTKDIFFDLTRQALAVCTNGHMVICKNEPWPIACQLYPPHLNLCGIPAPKGSSNQLDSGLCRQAGPRPGNGMCVRSQDPEVCCVAPTQALTVCLQGSSQHLTTLGSHSVTGDWHRGKRGDPWCRGCPGQLWPLAAGERPARATCTPMRCGPQKSQRHSHDAPRPHLLHSDSSPQPCPSAVSSSVSMQSSQRQ